ncbi:uncharacterized protein y4mH-like [Glandiceps talaboti]
MDFIDPHFHVWDFTDAARTGQSQEVIAQVIGETIPVYTIEEYLEDLCTIKNMSCKGCVWMECRSAIPLAEASWASGECLKLLGGSSIDEFRVVARCDLSDEDVKKRLRRMNIVSDLVGIRHVLKHHPTDQKLTDPTVERGDYIEDEDWLHGYGTLGDIALSFDLDVNPHQLEEFAKVVHRRPLTNVVINHMGSLTTSDPSTVETWRSGMQALAKQPQVYVKISALDRVIPKWNTDDNARQELRGYVREVIELFGADRCMFASNFPVEKCAGYCMAELYDTYREFVSDLDEKSQEDLFYGTAARFYKFGEFGTP